MNQFENPVMLTAGNGGLYNAEDICVRAVGRGCGPLVRQLIVDLIDPRLNQLVWRGWHVGAFYNRSPSAEEVSRSVERILEHFPPN